MALETDPDRPLERKLVGLHFNRVLDSKYYYQTKCIFGIQPNRYQVESLIQFDILDAKSSGRGQSSELQPYLHNKNSIRESLEWQS